jgi:hypothetical protein
LIANLDANIAALASRQHGVVARRQLVAGGFAPASISRRLADGRLLHLHRGVYAVAHIALRAVGYQLAAVLACGEDAWLSHRSAGAACEICVSHRARHEVTITSARGRSLTTVDVYRNRLHPDEVTVLDGVPITTVARTLLDLASVLNQARLVKCVERAELLGILDLTAVEAVLGRAHHRAGSATLREVLVAYRPDLHFTRSELELTALAFVREHDLPAPDVNTSVLGEELDLFWPGAAVNVECDGWATHRTRAAYERDRARDRRLQAAGICVVRVTATQLRTQRAAVADDIGRLLERRG